MGIVVELQREALSKDIDILVLLRKAYFVARKLKLKDFEAWANHELNGYSREDQLPDYRMYKGSVKFWNPYHGWLPVQFDKQSRLSIHQARDPIASLLDVYQNSTNRLATVLFNDDLNAELSKQNLFPTQFCLQFSTNLLYSTFESLRNKILEWAITLEENGIVGENMTFTLEEIQIAANTPVINNYTNNFYGSAGDTQIQQGENGRFEKNSR